LDFRRKLVRADQGDSLDIHAVNRGALDRAWSTVKRRAALGTGLIRIVVDICGNADMSADQLKWRGLAALALSRAMTKAGYSVEIVAGQAGGGGFNRREEIGVVTTTIKPRYANVDTATLASAVVMTGFFRFLGFLAIIKQADECGWDVNSGLGHDVSLHTVMPPAEKIAQVVTPKINDETAALNGWPIRSGSCKARPRCRRRPHSRVGRSQGALRGASRCALPRATTEP
jgi:hypothetical protein